MYPRARAQEIYGPLARTLNYSHLTPPDPDPSPASTAYRPDPMAQGEALLARMMAEWNGLPQALLRIALPGLGEEAVVSFVESMLKVAPGEAAEPGSKVAALSRGNPSRAIEVLNALRADGVLRLGERGWEWDANELAHFAEASEPADVLLARIASLPGAARQVLECLACLEHRVDRKCSGWRWMPGMPRSTRSCARSPSRLEVGV